MSRLHCARYTIPLHRPWWSTAWRALQLRYLRWMLRSIVDERDGNLASQEQARRELGDKFKPFVGEQYLANCEKQIKDFEGRISLLEVMS